MAVAVTFTQGIELVAMLSGIAYALLAVRRNRWAWLCGALSSALLVWLAAGAALPLQALLQGAYVAMAAYGFWHWSRGASADAPVRITRWQTSTHVYALIAVGVATVLLAPLLASNTPAASPWLDAAVTGLSLLATLMTARAVLENWVYWLVVDAASLVLYGSQGLYFIAILYGVYFVIAVFGLRLWWRQFQRDDR